MLTGKKILIAVSGSIAAYKIVSLTRLLIKAGAEVRIIMTEAAAQFVSPLVLGTLSRNKVLVHLFEDNVWADHVMLGRWADLMLVAPLSCNTLAKMANGQCDNLVLSVYLSATCPVMCAPAMDTDMWNHPATRHNMDILKQRRHVVLNVVSGELASGLVGEGRMAEPEDIFLEIESFFRKNTLKGKSILITSGPTYESIDPVRFIANHSTGKMGAALAESFYLYGADVVFVSSLNAVLPKFKTISVIPIVSAYEMFEACSTHFPTCDVAVLAAAVADYSPDVVAERKIKKQEALLELKLHKTKDILKELGRRKSAQILVGFALETDNALENARKKLMEKNADIIVLNSMQDAGAGFGFDTNKVTILDKSGAELNLPLNSKSEIADEIVALVIKKMTHA